MAEQYARALWEMVAKGMQPKKAVRALYDILVARGRTDLVPHVAKSFARLAARHQQKEGIVVSVARKKDERKALTAAKKIIAELGGRSTDVGVHLDESLIGGWRLEGRERLLDASFKKYLLSLYNQATQ